MNGKGLRLITTKKIKLIDMKLKTLVLASATAIFALGYTSCKKTDSSATDSSAATTVQATADQSASDNSSDDAQTAMTESINAVNPGISGDGIANHNNINPQTATCATISVDSSQGWPRTVTITFNNCPSLYGWFTRNGTLTAVLSGPIRTRVALLLLLLEATILLLYIMVMFINYRELISGRMFQIFRVFQEHGLARYFQAAK